MGKADSLSSESSAADSLVLPPAPARVVAAEVLLGSLFAAAAGYGVGSLAEHLGCDDCDASEPGGDVPGLILGVPAGATVGVWLVGRRHQPPGRLLDTALGACVGSAVFAGYSQMLEQQSDLVRWSGVVFSGAFSALAWNRSRPKVPPPGGRPHEPQSLILPVLGSNGEFAVVLRF